MQRPIQLLAIVPDEWLRSLRASLAPAQVSISAARDWQSALSILRTCPEIEVVLSASVLADATWKEVLAGASILQSPPRVVVAAHYADSSLWYDVLEEGAYDLMVYPFNADALLQTINFASADCRYERDLMDDAARCDLPRHGSLQAPKQKAIS